MPRSHARTPRAFLGRAELESAIRRLENSDLELTTSPCRLSGMTSSSPPAVDPAATHATPPPADDAPPQHSTSTDAELEAHTERMKAVKAAQDAKVREKTERRGITIVNTGDGKGKSTAAFGTALRSAGSGLNVGIVQFIKGTWKVGETEAFKRFPEIHHVVSGDGFTWNTQDKTQDIASAGKGWEQAVAMIEASRKPEPRYHLIILDEINIAIHLGYLPIKEVVEAVKNKPTALNLMLTGRGAKAELIAVADTVTEMQPIKHAFDAGIRAQRGIEF